MAWRSVRDLDVKGSRVFLRADLNVPLKAGAVSDATRIRETLPTLRHLLDGGAAVVLASHLGRPKGEGFETAFSLAPVAAWLKAEGLDVRLASGVTGPAVEAEAAALAPGQVLLLENLRFDKGETKNKPEFAAALAKLADAYVDDAFGAAHRAHASTCGVARIVRAWGGKCAAGLLMERELKFLGDELENPARPFVVILGGAKVSDKIKVIDRLLDKADTVLIGGAMAYTFKLAHGGRTGKSLIEKDHTGTALAAEAKAKQRGVKFHLPTDTVIATPVDTGKVNWVYQMTPFDEWDFDGINEMILADIPVKGKPTKALVHFDRNGFAYTLDRTNGALLVAEKYDPKVNWATHVDMKTGRPQVVAKYSTAQNGPDVNTKGVCPAALGSKDQQPASFDPNTGLFYVPTNHVCMDYEPFKVEYTAGQPYVGATLSMFPAPGSHGGMGNYITWDAGNGKIVQSKPEKFSVWSGSLNTAGGISCYGTLEGYFKCVDAKDITKELYKFRTPSGIIGNVFTYEHKGKQYMGVFSGIGGWAGIGMAAGLEKDTDGLGAVGGYRELNQYTDLGGTLTIFALPN